MYKVKSLTIAEYVRWKTKLCGLIFQIKGIRIIRQGAWIAAYQNSSERSTQTLQ